MKKKTTRITRLKRGDVTDRLYAAVIEYVENKGGNIVVIGGIQTQEWPLGAEGDFTIGIKCFGRKPEFKEKACSSASRRRK